MSRAIRGAFIMAAFIALTFAGYAAGRRLRPPKPVQVRLTADGILIREAHLGGATAFGALGVLGNYEPGDTFRDVLDKVQSEYVDRLDSEDKLGAGAVRTMLFSLDDPKTRYWDVKQHALIEKQLAGEYSGIGASLAILKQKRNEIEQRRVTVIAPVPGGPADRAGIRAGDSITEIDGKWVIAYDPRLDLNRLHLRTMAETQYRKVVREATKRLTEGISWPRALDRLMQPEGEDLKLTIERQGSPAPIKVTVTRAVTTVAPTEFRELQGGIGYLRVTQFAESAPSAVCAAIDKLQPKQPLIVDLRDNAGGPVWDGRRSAVRSVAGVLSELGLAGPVGMIARGASRQPVTAERKGIQARHMAVLVNKGTANLAEMAAHALNAKAAATLVGAATCGDSTYQKLVPLKSGGSMSISAGTIMTSAGKAVASDGLKPSVAVATGGPRVDGDAAVARAKALLTSAQGVRA